MVPSKMPWCVLSTPLTVGLDEATRLPSVPHHNSADRADRRSHPHLPTDQELLIVSHIFDRYFRKHGHFPRVEVVSGVQKITVEFSPGYVSIRSSHPYAAEVYITRTAFLRLLRKLLPLARLSMKHPSEDHDVPRALREAYFLELSLLQEKRALKKSRGSSQEDVDRQRRQRQRFLRARARSARQAEEED